MFRHLIKIEPLGLLYGSAGRFLSPENLVGRSGMSFPPSSATVSGIFAAALGDEAIGKGQDFHITGPFWAKSDDPENFYVPTPFNCLVKDDRIQAVMQWQSGENCVLWNADLELEITFPDGAWAVPCQHPDYAWQVPPNDKYQKGTWIAINDWQRLKQGALPPVASAPWTALPHLHPRLEAHQRRVDTAAQRGSLFLENAMQMEPDTCLVYLATHALPTSSDWYRFGGEGHMVEATCIPMSSSLSQRLDVPIDNQFALITPAVWGSNRLSYRNPQTLKKGDAKRHELPVVDSDLDVEWDVETMLTERPRPFRYRLGNYKTGDQPDSYTDVHQSGQPKLLSRGRYAVPAGTVYVLENGLDRAWSTWPDVWFPREGPSLKRWGLGLALPL